MRHDCDCEHHNTLDHIWTGDEIIPWTLDYPGIFRPSHPQKESKPSGSISNANWIVKLHAFFSKAFRIAIVLPIAGFLVLAIIIAIYMIV